MKKLDRGDKMNFIVHGPETKEEQEILNTKMAAIHADMIKVRLACSSLNELSKRKLIKEIYYEVTGRKPTNN
jgi:hypothetical protein